MEYKEVTDVIAVGHDVLSKIEARVSRSWLGRIFWHSVNVVWWTPPAWLAKSWEVEEPFRKGRALFIRYSWGRSLVLGFWGKTEYDEAEVLLNATLHGRKRTDGERRGWDDESYQEAEFDGDSSPLLQRRPDLRVRATVDAGADGQ